MILSVIKPRDEGETRLYLTLGGFRFGIIAQAQLMFWRPLSVLSTLFSIL